MPGCLQARTQPGWRRHDDTPTIVSTVPTARAGRVSLRTRLGFRALAAPLGVSIAVSPSTTSRGAVLTCAWGPAVTENEK